MKRILYIVSLILVASCSAYDDQWIIDEFGSYDKELSELEDMCSHANDDLLSIRALISALEKKDFVTDVDFNKEENVLRLSFKESGVIIISISDGADGDAVRNSDIPVFSVRKDSDGQWYWTVNGEWCRDGYGNKVPTLSNEDVTPSLKIQDGYWYISYDGGQSWIMSSKANGENGTDGQNGDRIISEYRAGEGILTLVLQDGSSITVPMFLTMDIVISDLPDQITANQSFDLTFEVFGADSKPEILCVGEHGWRGSISWISDSKGTIAVNAPEELADGKIVLFVEHKGTSMMKAIDFKAADRTEGVISLVADYYETDGSGGLVKVKLYSNVFYEVVIAEEDRKWISHIETKALREDDVLLAVSPNESGNPARCAVVRFVGPDVEESIIIQQRSKRMMESEIGDVDAFDDPENGITVLQTATKGTGTDIIIMGDGFTKSDFINDKNYQNIMVQAYEHFFSVEPYASLKEYFNVYYINAVSKDRHDADPYYDSYGNQNGAVNGMADTRFKTQFTPGSTSVSGDDDMVLTYAMQAIRYKGGPTGTPCGSESEVESRAKKSLMIVIPNVRCYAGTCYLTWISNTSKDYGNSYSIAYCPLGSDDTGYEFRWTLVHEAGGHGFGKLSDEYEAYTYTRFNTSEWYNLRSYHSYGIYRNVNEYWTYEESQMWSGLDWEYTTEENVYWGDLLDDGYDYGESEGLGIYKGGNGFTNMFCRPSSNSVMRNQFGQGGQYFNAASRWAIWYRVMRLTSSTSATTYYSSLDEFIAFDSSLNIAGNKSVEGAFFGQDVAYENFTPLAPPVLIEIEE